MVLALSLATILPFLATAGRPNVVFIVSDDLGVVTSNYGFPAKTPNLEAMAKRSVQFNRAYVSMAVCAPSRTAFLTGLRPDTTQVWTIDPYFRRTSRGQGLDVTTLPQLFRRAGYRTTGVGKIFHPGVASGGVSGAEGGGDMCPANSETGNCTWTGPGEEVGSWSEPYWFCDQFSNDTAQSPAMQGWPCAQGSWPSCGSGCVQDAECVQCFEDAGTWGDNLCWAETTCPDRCYPEGLIADQAIQVLEGYAKTPEKPFFLGIGFKRPHLTYKAPANYFDMYDLDAIPLPKYTSPSPTMPAIAFGHSCVGRNHMVKPYGTNESCREDGLCTELITNNTMIQELRRAYYAVVSLMDFHLGRVLDTLDSTGLSNNTIVTFIGDHGYQNGEKGAWCKSNNFELAVRIPMLVMPPLGDETYASTRGTISDEIVESVDLFPTIADIAGLAMPPRQLVPGQSLRPLLAGEAQWQGKGHALSQWPRRPSCLNKHGCLDGHGDPSAPADDQAVMGYTLRVPQWRYTAWFAFDYNASAPRWEEVSARELYTHEGDVGDMDSAESLEWENLADLPEHAQTVASLHTKLVEVVSAGLTLPMRSEELVEYL